MLNLHTKIPVCEIYPCLQGEAKYAGIPHILIRTMGCRCKCKFCDSWFTSWSPEKSMGTTYDSIDNLINKHLQISYAMITGGAPTIHPTVIQTIYRMFKEYSYKIVTLETEGSSFVPKCADFISLSPKFSNSTPVEGDVYHFLKRAVKRSEVEQHEKNRKNYVAMKQYMEEYADYQIKPVISSIMDFEELRQLQDILKFPSDKVYCMPEGMTNEELQQKRVWLANICIQEGYNYTDRLHTIIYGPKRGV